MSFKTPRGLKVRLDIPWGFSLLTRLWKADPKTDAFRVLKTCEAIENVPTIVSLAAGLIAVFTPGFPRLGIPLSMAVGFCLGQLLTQFGVFVVIRPIGLLLAGLIWSYIPSTIMMVHVPLLVLFWVRFGWAVAALWILGLAVSLICFAAMEHTVMLWRFKKYGITITLSEINFFNAYRIHADRLGMTRDIDLVPGEAESADWEACLLDYARKWPESVARFLPEA